MKITPKMVVAGSLAGVVVLGAVALQWSTSKQSTFGQVTGIGQVAGEYKTPLATPDPQESFGGTAAAAAPASAAYPAPATPVTPATTPLPATPEPSAAPTPAPTPYPSATPVIAPTPRPLPTIAPCGTCGGPILNKSNQAVACPLIMCPQAQAL